MTNADLSVWASTGNRNVLLRILSSTGARVVEQRSERKFSYIAINVANLYLNNPLIAMRLHIADF